MDPVAFLGLETEIRLYNTTTLVFDPIPFAYAIALPGISTDIVNVTTNTSPNGFREKMPGLKDLGDVTFSINLQITDEATHAALWDLQQASELGDFQIAFPQRATNNLFDFSAYVTGLPIDSPIDAQVAQNVTLTGTGNIERSTE